MALVVDDEEMLRHLTARMLGDLGWVVVTARDGIEALTAIEADGRIRLVVTDLQMPRMRGDDLARRIRRLRPAVSILLVSAAIDTISPWDDTVRLLPKPLTVQDLARELERLETSRAGT